MKPIAIRLLIAAALTCTCPGQDSETTGTQVSPEVAAVTALDRAYEEAYAKGDAPALAAFFTEDAEYTSDTGQTYHGKASIEELLRGSFAGNKGAKISIDADSVKPLTSEVIVEKGSTHVTSSGGDESQSLYTAIYVKKDDKWKISQLIETPSPDSTANDQLSQLSWLIGKWRETDKEAGVNIQSSYQWAKGGRFITRNVSVKKGDDAVLDGWQIIGWDPVEEEIRSWTFDDEGGYSEGHWSGSGGRWLCRETGYAPDGSRTAADNTIARSGDDKLFWESGNRTLDGVPQPGLGRIEIQRAKGE